MTSFPCRVILLLDLDCFYASCERVRLGLESNSCSLALLQWDSVLAVTYPARQAFGIQRGDSWDAVSNKSGGKCLAIHLPVFTKEGAAAANSDDTRNSDESIEEAYRRVYCLTEEKQEQARNAELGVKRFASQGKACLERYRIASSRIFALVVETLVQQLGKDNFVLERASIDELFIDVTKYCWQNESLDGNVDNVMCKTVTVGEDPQSNQTNDENHDEDDPNIKLALERGCVVAHNVRKAVFDTLGFTLSAGISTCKLVAKLGASYGKPNGQALILPSAISRVMNETEIRKVRNLGGKVGKQVLALLPPGEATTMGSIARLSLPVLCENLGNDIGKMVYNACRGMDEEPVKETAGALVKSITAFKSFQKISINSGELTEWIALLATDVGSRVQMDSARNNRYPKSCTVQYTCSKEHESARATRSVRIPFPRDGDVKTKLVQRAKDAVYAKEGNKVFLYRIGLCAVDFQVKMANGGISSFFSKGNSPIAAKPISHESAMKSTEVNDKVDSEAQCQHDEEIARKLQSQYKANLKSVDDTPKVQDKCPDTVVAPASSSSADEEIARKLQSQFDRENYVLSMAEKRSATKPKQPATSKKQRIDNFFRKT